MGWTIPRRRVVSSRRGVPRHRRVVSYPVVVLSRLVVPLLVVSWWLSLVVVVLGHPSHMMIGPHPLLEGRGSRPCRRAWVEGELRWKRRRWWRWKEKGMKTRLRVSRMSHMSKLRSPPMIMIAYCVRCNDNGFLAVDRCRICI